MKRLFPTLLVLQLLALLLSGCNLYMDDDDLKQDNEENGDGITAPRTISDSISTVTYQFREGTKMLDKRYRPFILRYRTDSLYNQTEIYLSRNIPSVLIPERGNYLSTDLYDIFDGGLIHQVDAVVAEGDQLVVKAHRATIDDVFEKLDITSDFSLAPDSVPAADEATRAGEARTYGFKPVAVRKGTRASSDENKPIDINKTYLDAEVNYLPSIDPDMFFNEKYNRYASRFQKLGALKKLRDKSLIKPFGTIDGGLGMALKVGMKVHFEYRKEDKYVDFHGVNYFQVDFGFFFKEVKGGFCVPLIGHGAKTVKRSNKTTGSSTTKVEKYIVDLLTKDIPIPAGPLKMDLNVQPNLVADVYAAFKPTEDDDQLLYAAHYEETFSEFGFHDDPVNGTYGYPREKSGSKSKSESDEFSWSCDAGVELHAELAATLKFYKTLEASIVPEVAVAFGYENTLTDKYKLEDFTLTSGGMPHTLEYGSDCNRYVRLSCDISLRGKLVFWKFWTVDLFDITVAETSMQWNWRLYPEFNLDIKENKALSTQETTYLDAYLKAKSDFVYTPREAPMLAIYSAPTSNTGGPKKFVKIVAAENKTPAFDSKTTYHFHYSIPGRDIFNTYYAVPVYVTGLGITREYYHATPTPFFSSFVSLVVSDMEQFVVRSSPDGENSNLYAFKFHLGGVAPAVDRKHRLLIMIYDKEGGEKLASKFFSLGTLRGRVDRDYVFYFTGNDVSYYVLVSYYIEEGTNVYEFSTADLTLFYGSGTKEIDDLRYDFTGTQTDYHVLQ